MRTFNNLEELEQHNKELSIELVKTHGQGDWVEEQLFVYDNVADYAKYELTDGWYAESMIDQDWSGAPNPMDHIDLESLGNALTSSWDRSSYHLTKDNVVIETAHGW